MKYKSQHFASSILDKYSLCSNV